MMPSLFSSCDDFNEWFNFDTSDYNKNAKKKEMSQE